MAEPLIPQKPRNLNFKLDASFILFSKAVYCLMADALKTKVTLKVPVTSLKAKGMWLPWLDVWSL